jgi:hypothetical protein
VSLESVEQALVDLATEVRTTMEEQQRMVETYKTENEQMHAIVTAARRLTGEGTGWFFRIAVPGEDMDALTSALSEYQGRG